MRWKALLVLFVCLFIFLSPSKSSALSCAEFEEPVLDHFDAAVVGTVLDVKEDQTEGALSGTEEMRKLVLIDVEKSWKQEFKSQTIFEADFSWGFDFKEGETYLIYLNGEEGAYTNSPCSPVEQVDVGEADEMLPSDGQVPTEEANLGYKMAFASGKDLDMMFASMFVAVSFIVLWVWYRNVRKEDQF